MAIKPDYRESKRGRWRLFYVDEDTGKNLMQSVANFKTAEEAARLHTEVVDSVGGNVVIAERLAQERGQTIAAQGQRIKALERSLVEARDNLKHENVASLRHQLDELRKQYDARYTESVNAQTELQSVRAANERQAEIIMAMQGRRWWQFWR